MMNVLFDIYFSKEAIGEQLENQWHINPTINANSN